LIKDAKNDEIICDIVSDGQEVLLACGGKGGRGNVHFKTSVNQAPRRYDEGERGEVFDLVLELKLLADVGLVGCPNAGKSTLVSRFSAAKPKIANYPFTTLKPVLGVVQCALGESYVMADIPGLIEGAHEGTGLGDEFLRHVERTRVLVFVLDLSGYENDPRSDYAMLCNEIESYDSRIAQKKKIIALNKCDLPYNEEIVDHFKTEGLEVFLISGVTGEGCQQLHNCIWETLNSREEE
jgi:GTP-binding protein